MYRNFLFSVNEKGKALIYFMTCRVHYDHRPARITGLQIDKFMSMDKVITLTLLPHPLRISNSLRGGGIDFFLEPHNVNVFNLEFVFLWKCLLLFLCDHLITMNWGAKCFISYEYWLTTDRLANLTEVLFHWVSVDGFQSWSFDGDYYVALWDPSI